MTAEDGEIMETHSEEYSDGDHGMEAKALVVAVPEDEEHMKMMHMMKKFMHEYPQFKHYMK
jgi:hypothetical protein